MLQRVCVYDSVCVCVRFWMNVFLCVFDDFLQVLGLINPTPIMTVWVRFIVQVLKCITCGECECVCVSLEFLLLLQVFFSLCCVLLPSSIYKL